MPESSASPWPTTTYSRSHSCSHDAGFDDTAEALVVALEGKQALVVDLSIQDREGILSTLDDPQTDALAELRETLLLEHEWRVRVGLA